ncbi:MAG: ABC transporter ATP-binding protein [Candidatus Peribacteraceae bacterium]|nr:ABC transporter ATP-binding protein [Candidatus Peribacteraceae bacterium]
MFDVFRAYWPSIRAYRWTFMLTTVLMFVGILAKSAYPLLLKDILDLFAAGDKGPGLDRALWTIGLLFIVVNAIWIWYDNMIIRFEAGVMKDLEHRAFAAVMAQSSRFFENSFTGSLTKSSNRFRAAFETIADAWFFQIGRSLVLIIITLVAFVVYNPPIAGILLAWVVAFIVFNLKTAKIRYRLSKEEADADSACGGALADAVGNAATVKGFGREHEERQRFGNYVEECFRTRKRAWFSTIVIMRAQGLLMAVLEFAILWWLIKGWQAGTVTIGDFVLFQTYVLLLMQQLWDFGSQLHRVYQNAADAKEMADIIGSEPEVRDAPGAVRLNLAEPTVEFHAVTFRYQVEAGLAVDGFSLTIGAGEKVALVGPSGAGKTTLAKLLLRLYDLDSGYIAIGGQDISSVMQVSLRQQVAVVSQTTELFHRSIRDNIRFARPDADEAEIIAAAKRAHAWEFIEALPNGLDTLVGERGIKLSGGQRQRITLARAFLADTSIVILDEATSALDSATEAHIQAAIKDLMEGRTVIAIAHRLSTIMGSDRIVVMDGGKIVEVGDHAELLEHQGVYATLWAHQSGGYIA